MNAINPLAKFAQLSLIILTGALIFGAALVAQVPGTMKEAFIYDQAPFDSCHASTIVETEGGDLLAAWFGGSEEGAPDVTIWMSRNGGSGWSTPIEVANGLDERKGTRYPCWNPVLFQPSGGPLFLFYKVGPNPRDWWGLYLTSPDNGYTWSEPVRLRKGIFGPIRCKPLDLGDGLVLAGSSTEDAGWRVHMEIGKRYGKLWTRTKPLHNAMQAGAIQPTILDWGDRGIQILCRTKQRRILTSWSTNKGRSWSDVTFTDLPNPSAGIDAVRLKDGRALLVYNHTKSGRSPLNIALSSDGMEWSEPLALETLPGEYSYPAVIQSSDGSVHVTYTWRRQKIKHVVINPAELPPIN